MWHRLRTDISIVGLLARRASRRDQNLGPGLLHSRERDSTNGALVLANAQGVDRRAFFRQLMVYGALVTVVAPFAVWLLFVVI